jgi:hypothetical protein
LDLRLIPRIIRRGGKTEKQCRLMAQVYQSASIKLGDEVVTIIYVSYSAIATDQMASRSLSAMKPLFKNSTLVLAAQGINLAPEFVGPKHVVDVLRGRALAEFKWYPVSVG